MLRLVRRLWIRVLISRMLCRDRGGIISGLWLLSSIVVVCPILIRDCALLCLCLRRRVHPLGVLVRRLRAHFLMSSGGGGGGGVCRGGIILGLWLLNTIVIVCPMLIRNCALLCLCLRRRLNTLGVLGVGVGMSVCMSRRGDGGGDYGGGIVLRLILLLRLLVLEQRFCLGCLRYLFLLEKRAHIYVYI